MRHLWGATLCLCVLRAHAWSFGTAPSVAPARHAAAARSRVRAPAPRASEVAEASIAEPSLPPNSFAELIKQAASAVELALVDGNTVMEVEFPPLPVSQLEDSNLRCACK